ncbi:MAG TPA: TldD/PmbA family protein [Terriglobales bacterium]|nr:TldD/PmbA family protein [Terriglobales bacterium]
MLSRDDARKLIDQVLSYSKADDCQVTIGERDLAQTRFAVNSITTSGRSDGVAIYIWSTKDRRTGQVATNETSEDALRKAVARSEELAGFAPPDPEYVEPLSPQKYPEIPSYDAATAAAAQKEILSAVKTAVEASQAKGVVSSGYYERTASALALGNKRGNFAYATRTRAEYSLTSRTPDGTGSGWASAEGHRMGDVDGARIAGIAIDKAVLSRKPRPLEPGKYTVVLESAAVSDLLAYMFGLGGVFDARAAEEGRSLFTRRGGGTRLGEKMFSEKITVRSDPFDSRNPGRPWVGNVEVEIGGVGQIFFGGAGVAGPSYLPTEKIDWIEKGVVKNLVYTRYWAEKKGVNPTPLPAANLVMEGEDHSVEDLVRSTERGLLVTHFWYIRYVNLQTVQVTGLTRDGLFWIENGKITHPVMNFRFNESPANVLANVEMLGRPELSDNRIVPAMKVRDFTFSSVSDAV